MYADQPTTASKSTANSEEPFKVQRSPDGKLNVVFNDYLFLQKMSTQHENRTPNPDSFVFPGPTTIPAHLVGKKVKCEDRINENKPFCTKVSNYPDITPLEDILKSEFANFFGEDLTQPIDITQRMNTPPDESYLCDSSERTIFPEAGETKDSTWRTIVNKDKFKQGIKIEECSNIGSKCKHMDSLNLQYRAYCKQNYIYRTMVAVSEDGKRVTKDQFKMPSCCKCVVQTVIKN